MQKPTRGAAAPSLVASLSLAALLPATGATAAVFVEAEGPTLSGLNDRLGTAQNLGALPRAEESLNVTGFVAANNPNDVDFYRFDVVGGPLGVFFDIDFAGTFGINAEGFEVFSGLDASLSVFDASGSLTAFNEISDFFLSGDENEGTDPGSDASGDLDPFIGELTLAEGSWLVAVAYAFNRPGALPEDAGAGTPLSFSGLQYSGLDANADFARDQDPGIITSDDLGGYRLDVRTSFDEVAVTPAVPEPASFALLACGGGLLLRRRR